MRERSTRLQLIRSVQIQSRAQLKVKRHGAEVTVRPGYLSAAFNVMSPGDR